MIYTTDVIGGEQASDVGERQAVFYRRRPENGTTGSAPVRLSHLLKHGDRPTIAANGSLLIVMWSSFPSYDTPDPMADRGIYVRRSIDAGATWRQTENLSRLPNNPIDAPSIAVTASSFWWVLTQTEDGEMEVAEIPAQPCTDCGGLGFLFGPTTNSEGAAGLSGRAVVAASGGHAIVAWVDDDEGTIKARYSNAGVTELGPAFVVATNAWDVKTGIDVAMKGSRSYVTWSTARPSSCA